MEVTIERILPGGLGLAHADGQTVMVALAAPGDRVRVRVDRVKGTIAFASIEEIISPSPARVEPPCPYFGRCGGCDFQQLNYEAQIAAKVEIVKDCLRRIGGIESIPEFLITPAPKHWHYRARAQWQYDSIRKRLGYFESGSRHVCDVAECAVLVPELQQTLEELRRKMKRVISAPYSETTTFRLQVTVFVRPERTSTGLARRQIFHGRSGMKLTVSTRKVFFRRMLIFCLSSSMPRCLTPWEAPPSNSIAELDYSRFRLPGDSRR